MDFLGFTAIVFTFAICPLSAWPVRIFLFRPVNIQAERYNMCVQWVRLCKKAGECVVNHQPFYLKANANRGLEERNFLCIGCVCIIQNTLKITYAPTKE